MKFYGARFSQPLDAVRCSFMVQWRHQGECDSNALAYHAYAHVIARHRQFEVASFFAAVISGHFYF